MSTNDNIINALANKLSIGMFIENVLIGYALIVNTKDGCLLDKYYISSHYTGNALHKYLFQKIYKRLLENSIKTINVYVSPLNLKSIYCLTNSIFNFKYEKDVEIYGVSRQKYIGTIK